MREYRELAMIGVGRFVKFCIRHAGALFLACLMSSGYVSTGACADSASEDFSRSLTRQDVVAYGLAHNRSYRAAEEEVKAFKQRVKESKADFYPKVDSSYTFQHLKDQPFAQLLNMRFPVAPSTTNRWEIDVSQPLFTGFGLTAQLKISQMDLIIAEQKLEEARLNLVRDILHSFWQTLLAERLLQVARDSVASLEIHRSNAEAYFQQGLAVRNDVLKADVALSQARQNERKVSKQLTVLRSKLNQLLDRDLQAKIQLSEGDMSLNLPPDLDDLYALAENDRPEYVSINTSLRQVDQRITEVKSKYYPHLSAFAQYYREGYDFLANRNGYVNGDNAAVGVRVDWNLFEGGKTNAAVNELVYRKNSLEERKQDLRQQIRLQVEDAYEQALLARDNVETARTALKQAEENERMTALQYKEQLVIFLEVLNAQVFVTQTRVDYNQALYGYELACADLERAAGGPVNYNSGEGKKKRPSKAPKIPDDGEVDSLHGKSESE